jgi:cytochrome bd-type quinol oxidase subunit 2
MLTTINTHFSKIVFAILSSLSLVILFNFALSTNVSAQNTDNLCTGASLTFNETDANKECKNTVSGEAAACANEPGGCPQKGINKLIKQIIDVFSIIVGVVAVIMIIYGGFRYITSGGDSNNVSAAKNTLIYAIVGLVIVAFAQIIVKFILDKATAG